MNYTITYDLAIGQRVNIDGDRHLVGTVTAVQWRSPHHIAYEVSWVTNGEMRCAIVEGWRLSRAD